MKGSKELKAGLIAIASIALLVCGVNFLKGNSFFGGDDQYVAYFPDSGKLTPATSVYVNGVVVGKVLAVELNEQGDSASKVKVTFNIQEENFRIPRGSKIEIGSYDLFNKGILIEIKAKVDNGYYTKNDKIYGRIQMELTDELLAKVDPSLSKFNNLISNVDKTIESMSAFWDTTANSEIQSSMVEIRTAITRFGRVAAEVEGLVVSEKAKLGRIFSNLESISTNLKASNEKISAIIGNTQKITDELTTVNYKEILGDAQQTVKKFNTLLDDINSGNGSLGKLLKDDKMYNELIKTNGQLQELVNDIELHPERYIHFSVLGAKTKGVKLTGKEEKKLRKVLDSIPD